MSQYPIANLLALRYYLCMRQHIIFAWAILLALVIHTPAWAGSMPRESFFILTKSGKTYDFQVEIADTPLQRMKGLQGRHHLAEDAGMLFVFEEPQSIAMWMKDTLIPLDMLFIDTTNRIIKIHTAYTPGSLKSISSSGPVSAVLELNAGIAKKYGISIGDSIHRSE